MKKSLIVVLLLINTLVFAQIDENLMKTNWKPGKELIIYGNVIMRDEGKNDIGGITNIGYETIEQVISNIEKKADKEMWTPEKKKENIETYSKFSSGGLVHLYITRLTIDAANTDMFTVIVKDSTDSNDIYRKELKRDIPNTPPSGSRYWWNYTSVPLPNKVTGKIFIYIIDKLGGDNNKFKFEVTI